ncbi:MAG TPA: hypothetical protein VHC48_19575 [Puia sp.]|nr:hypothetical protein [Puia sp.]
MYSPDFSNKNNGDTDLILRFRTIKNKYPEAILLLKVGNFYESFDQDAIITSQVLGTPLTKANNGTMASHDFARFPSRAFDAHLRMLLKAGYRVAVSDQLKYPEAAV